MSLHITPAQDAAAAPRSRFFHDDLDVLASCGRPRLPGAGRIAFGDDVWDFRGCIDLPPTQRLNAVLNFATIDDDALRLTAKELVMWLLNPALRHEHDVFMPLCSNAPLPPWQLPKWMSLLRTYLNWLHKQGLTDLTRVGDSINDRYLLECRTYSKFGKKELSASTRHQDVMAIRMLHEYAAGLTLPSFGSRPWGDKSSLDIVGYKPVKGPAANLTAPVPSEVYAPLMAAALHVVDQMGESIAAAVEHPSYPAELPFRELKSRSNDVLRTTGSQNVVVTGGERDLDRTPGHTWCPGTWTFRAVDYYRDITLTACVLVIAGLSGMRSSEIASLHGHDAVYEESLAGDQRRWWLTGTLVKGQGDATVPVEWTVIEPVVRAYRLALRLSNAPHPLAAMTVGWDHLLPRFTAWANRIGHQELGVCGEIAHDGPLGLDRFRRRLAIALASTPNGVIAGMVHLKHVQVATSLGYYADPQSALASFAADVQQEYEQAQLDEAVQAFAVWESNPEDVRGLGTRSLDSLFTAVQSAVPVPKGGSVELRDEAIRAALKRHASKLHATRFNYCLYLNPKAAACQIAARKRGIDSDESAPLVGSCEPLGCINSTVFPRHRAEWDDEREELRWRLRQRHLPALDRKRLQARLSELDATLDPDVGAAGP